MPIDRAGAFPIGAAATLEDLEHPHVLLARLREREPVSWLPALEAWLVTRRDLALQVMRDAETFTVEDPRFSTGRVVGPSMLTLDGAAHARHRAPFARPFRLAAVRERFAEPVAAEADRLIDAFELAGHAELRREFAGPLAAAAVTHVLGLEGADTAASTWRARTRACTWPSRTERTCASACTSRGSRRTPGSSGCCGAFRACGSIRPSELAARARVPQAVRVARAVVSARGRSRAHDPAAPPAAPLRWRERRA